MKTRTVRPNRAWALAMAGAVMAMGTLFASSAQAAQPYWCTCHGKAKRFLASTNKCEHDHHVKSCSRTQFKAFQRAACASNGCRPR